MVEGITTIMSITSINMIKEEMIIPITEETITITDSSRILMQMNKENQVIVKRDIILNRIIIDKESSMITEGANVKQYQQDLCKSLLEIHTLLKYLPYLWMKEINIIEG